VGITPWHIPYYEEAFALPGFFSEPVLLFGVQGIHLHKKLKPRRIERPIGTLGLLRRAVRRRLGLPVESPWALEERPNPEVPEAFRVDNLSAYLENRGINDVELLDLFDARATLRYDMNQPVPESEHERYGTFIDIGCLEHLFDTRQCLENCLRMVRVGGTYFLVTPVNGYLRHGLHVFNPDGLASALELNGFEILYRRHSARDGTPLDDPSEARDAILWIAGRKTCPLKRFEVPQQAIWRDRYVSPP
jgi:hypothetical protein